jgi:hypothetical protein
MGAEALLRCRTMTAGATAICRLTADRFNALNAAGLFSGGFHLVARRRGVHLFAEDGSVAPFHPLLQAELEVTK